MSARADPLRDLDGGLAGATAELSNDMPWPNVGGFIESQ
jgi:hypothetical protein